MMYELTNDFHNTSATVRVGKNGFMSPRTVKRVERELCGIDGCTCGRYGLGVRGPQAGIESIEYATPDGGLKIVPKS